MDNTAILPTIGAEVFATESRTNIIYEAVYKDEPCYCVEYVPTGHKELIEYDKDLLATIIRKIDRCGALAAEKKRDVTRLKFHKTRKEYGISLRLYVYAKYHKLGIEKVRSHKIMLHDTVLKDFNIADLRKSNLYDASGFRPFKGNVSVEIATNPDSPEQRCIVVTYCSTGDNFTEIYDYSDELYQILCSSQWCKISISRESNRLGATIHYGKSKDKYKIINLSRFVLFYLTYFEKYRNMRGSIKRFIHDIPKLSDELKADEDAAHINADKWNGSKNNLQWMSSTTNDGMLDYITNFCNRYDAFAVANDAGEILVEFTAHGNTHFYKCETAEDYLDLQKFFLGKCKITDHLKINHVGDEFVQVPTPKDEYAKYRQIQERKRVTREDISPYWQRKSRADKLLANYAANPQMFSAWRQKCDGIKINSVEDIQDLINVCFQFIPNL